MSLANDASNFGSQNGMTITTGALPTGLLAVLSNPIRFELLASLAGAEKSVGDLAAQHDLDFSTVSHALKVLSEWGLVEFNVEKRHHRYRLTRAVKASVGHNQVTIELTMKDMHVILEHRIEET